ncbi:MAG TPA: FAD-dependent monooxygenase [Mycobacterium sp.]|nr:FAD-dependent monooxygenase [Mycobacterium sp.]
MDHSEDVEVLVAGAGPVGLTAAIELARRGVAVRVVDPLTEPPRYAKAVGVQPRSLEVFEQMGVLGEMLDAAIPMRGQYVYVNGVKVGEMDLPLPAGVPFGFADIPQYETERILREALRRRGGSVERGVEVTGFTQSADSVTGLLSDGSSVRARYLIGADGAHSTVRKTLGLTFDGGAFEEQYMLGDVEVDWSIPRGMAVRAMHQTDGATDDLLVCIPLPGRGRYRMSMLVPPELRVSTTASGDGVAHGFEGDRRPGLEHIQAVLDRLAPEPTTARNLRWSSVFRISHRIVNAYGRGRVFVAGDAAHIHPPTGGQGMNTGIQDAHNLAWKLALALAGRAAAGLLDSYDAERRPVGEEVVGRTVRSARAGIGADSSDPDFVVRREAQLLIDYGDSPIVNRPGDVDWRAVAAGRRAPDAAGLTRDLVAGPVRLFSVLTGERHVLLVYTAAAVDVAQVEDFCATAAAAAHGALDCYLVVAPGADVGDTVLPVLGDAAGAFAGAYSPGATAVYVVRPDGYLGYVSDRIDASSLFTHLELTFASPGGRRRLDAAAAGGSGRSDVSERIEEILAAEDSR